MPNAPAGVNCIAFGVVQGIPTFITAGACATNQMGRSIDGGATWVASVQTGLTGGLTGVTYISGPSPQWVVSQNSAANILLASPDAGITNVQWDQVALPVAGATVSRVQYIPSLNLLVGASSAVIITASVTAEDLQFTSPPYFNLYGITYTNAGAFGPKNIFTF